MDQDYVNPQRSQLESISKPSSGDHHAENLPLHRMRDRVLGPGLLASATDPVRPGQGEGTARQKPLNSNWTLLQEVPFRASAQGNGQSLASVRSRKAHTTSDTCALLRAQDSSLSPVAGSLRALSVGNAGEQPTTSGAARLPASISVPIKPQGQKRAPSPRSAATGRGRGERTERKA